MANSRKNIPFLKVLLLSACPDFCRGSVCRNGIQTLLVIGISAILAAITGCRSAYPLKTNSLQATRMEGDVKMPDNPPGWRKIVFQSTYTGHRQIFTMNADGSGQTELTFGRCDANMPKWSGYLGSR